MRAKPYAEYKSSGIEWLGDVPAQWGVKRLKYTASINDDALPETTSPDFEFSYVDIGSVDRVEGIISTEEMVFESAPSRARRIVREGDTIVSTVRTYLRAIAPIQNPKPNLIVSTGFAVVRPRGIKPRFLSYALRESSFVETLVSKSVGVSYPAVNASEVATIPIPLPSPNEQDIIADYLDRETSKIDVLIAKKRDLIDKLKEKRTALISRTVTQGLPPDAARTAGLDPNPKLKPSGIDWLGDVPEHWEVTQLFRNASTIQTGPFGSQLHASDYVEDGIPLINPAHIVAGRLIPYSESCVDEPTATRLARHRLQEGDIIMGRRGEIGRCAPVTKSEAGWVCGTGSLIVRLMSGDSRYFVRVFSDAGFSKLLELHAVGTTMLNLNPTIVGRMFVPIPPPAEQVAIADYLEVETKKLDQLAEMVGAAVERLQEYRAALITATVTGKIDIRRSNGQQVQGLDRRAEGAY